MIKHIIMKIIKDTTVTKIKFNEITQNYIYINNHIICYNQIIYCFNRDNNAEIGADSAILQHETYNVDFDIRKNISVIDFYQNGRWLCFGDRS
jgi:hypothetical protein